MSMQSRAVPIVVNVYFTINRIGGERIAHSMTAMGAVKTSDYSDVERGSGLLVPGCNRGPLCETVTSTSVQIRQCCICSHMKPISWPGP